MNRITLRQPINEALALLPERIRARVQCDYLTGCDPVFVGLHRYAETTDGRAYKDCAHVAWSLHQDHMPRDHRAPTVVLPSEEDPWTTAVIVHELGHVLDESIGFDRHKPEPVSQYAERDEYEAFAEAFTLWIWGDIDGYRPQVLRNDARTLRLFEELSCA